ncbi:MAG: crossover junction endodeoxyribonuclease RuvC [Smithellaceae bacterium]|nr:crossover junction endodeoxyribonuclease RuvC [Smithellaceae bacterium]
MTRILGIDPGNHVTGLGVVEKNKDRLTCIYYGEIRSPKDLSLPARLVNIYQKLQEVIDETMPEAVAIEGIFYGKNPDSLIKQGQVRGVAILAGAQGGRSVYEYSPLEVKKAVVGYGRAEKSQVQIMVKSILALEAIPPEDAADALAVAICHANNSRMAFV